MKSWKTALLALSHHWQTTASALLVMALVVSGTLTLYKIITAWERSQNEWSKGPDMVLGASGNDVQLVLNATLGIGSPTKNIAPQNVDSLLHSPLVKLAIPICHGDAIGRVPLTGTNEDYFKLYQLKINQGTFWNHDNHVILGQEAASALGAKAGDTLFSAHGQGEIHHHPLVVSGILEPTVLPASHLAFVSTNHYYHMHPSSSGEVTAFLIKSAGPMALFALPRLLVNKPHLQLAMPAVVWSILNDRVTTTFEFIRKLSWGLAAAAALLLWLSLHNLSQVRVNERLLYRLQGLSPWLLAKHRLIELAFLWGAALLVGYGLQLLLIQVMLLQWPQLELFTSRQIPWPVVLLLLSWVTLTIFQVVYSTKVWKHED